MTNIINKPDSWIEVAVSDIIQKISTNRKKIRQKDYLESGSLPIIDQGNKHIGGYTNDFSKKIDCELPVIVFGDHTKIIKFINFDFAAGADGVKVIKPITCYETKLFQFFLKVLVNKIPDKGYARHFQHIEKLKSPLPPLPEQHRIVAKIEELFSELDNGIENLKKAREQLKTYRQAVLKYAFEGKLTKEWRIRQREAGNPPEPAEKLLEQIKTEREKHYLKQCQIAQNNGERRPKKLDTSFIEKNKPSFGLPPNWVWCRITDLFIELTDYHANGSYKKLKEKVELFDEPNYALMVRATNFEKKDFKNSCKYISKEAYRFLSKSKLYGGELLIGKIGNAGKVYYMPLLNRPTSLAMNLFALRFDSEFVSKYGYYHLISPFSEKDISSYVKGVGNITIDKKSVRSLLIALPPFKEQHTIVQEIESRLSVCDKLEQTIEDSLKKAEALRQSILKKAFAGELTKDWREKHPELITGENSAEKLLEKIKAEKAHAASRKKPRSKKTKKK